MGGNAITRALGVLLLATLLRPAVAHADSDGYYCTGPGYLAYEMRFSQAPGKHLLHIVRFSHDTGIVRLPPVLLDDFQVHAMTCGADQNVVDGWAHRYTVSLLPSGTPRVAVGALPAGHPEAPFRDTARLFEGVFLETVD
jgi:hypothetical protein